MSDSYWGIKERHLLTAVVVTTFLVSTVFIGIFSSYKHEAAYHKLSTSKANADAMDAYKQKCASLLSVKDVASCFEKAVDGARETQRLEEDLYAQKAMAQWAFWMLIVTSAVGTASIAVAVFGVVFVSRSFELTRQVFIRDHSPAVYITASAVGSLIFEEAINQARCSLNIRANNHGKTPAVNVCPAVAAVDGRKLNNAEIWNEYSKFIEFARANNIRDHPGYLAMPGGYCDIGICPQVTIPEDRFSKFRFLVFIGISYFDEIGQKQKHTFIILLIGRKSSEPLVPFTEIEIHNGDVSADDIVIWPYPGSYRSFEDD